MKKRILITTLSLSAFLVAGFFMADASAQDKQSLATNPEFVGTIVTTGSPAAVAAQLKRSGITPREKTRLQSQDQTMFVLDEPFLAPQVLALERNIFDTKTQPNYVYKTALEPDDPRYQDGSQWNIDKISAPNGWDITTGASTTTIAVIDTGVLSSQSWGDGTHDESHAEFPDSKIWKNPGETGMTEAGDPCFNTVPEDKSTNGCDDDDNSKVDDWRGWDFMGGFVGDSSCPNFDSGESAGTYIQRDNDPQPYSCDNPNDPTLLNKLHGDGSKCGYALDRGACFIGHGTIVGSVAAAATNNTAFIAGLDWNAQLMNLRALDGYGVGFTSDIINAVNYAAAEGADVLNMSLAVDDCSGSFSDPAFESALKTARDNGVISAAASGNDGFSTVCYPASSPHVIAVGATDENDERQSYSNFGSKLDVVAPAGVPAATAPSNSNGNTKFHGNAHGTSLSTPHVSGLAALMKSEITTVSLTDIMVTLEISSDKVSGMNGANRTDTYGFGRINARKNLGFLNLQHPDGTLIKARDSNAVYWLEDGQRQHVLNPAVFRSHGFSGLRVELATPTDNTLPGGPPLNFREGALVKGSSNTIWVVDYEGGSIRKRGFTNLQAFLGLGFEGKDVLRTSDSRLPSDNGPNITNASLHPDGTLIKATNNNAVFWLEDGKRRHVRNPPVFISHGFSGLRIETSTADDKNLPPGPSLNFREGAIVRAGPPIYVINYEAGVIEKRWIANLTTYSFLGYAAGDILKTSSDRLPSQNGSTIRY